MTLQYAFDRRHAEENTFADIVDWAMICLCLKIIFAHRRFAAVTIQQNKYKKPISSLLCGGNAARLAPMRALNVSWRAEAQDD